MTDTQTCRRCGEDKPLTDYAPHPDIPGQRLATCRTCRGKAQTTKRVETVPSVTLGLDWRAAGRPPTEDEYRAGIRKRLRARREIS